MKLIHILLITFLLSISLGLPAVQPEAPAQELTPFTSKALTYFQNADYKSAVRELRQAVQTNPQDAFAWYILAVSHGNLRNWDQSAEAYRKSLSLNPHPQWGKVDER